MCYRKSESLFRSGAKGLNFGLNFGHRMVTGGVCRRYAQVGMGKR